MCRAHGKWRRRGSVPSFHVAACYYVEKVACAIVILGGNVNTGVVHGTASELDSISVSAVSEIRSIHAG